MNNFKPSRSGFRFEVLQSESGNKRNIAVIEIMYLKGAQRKGVLASVKHVEVEQCEGYTTESTTLFSEGNFTVWVKELARKSDKAVLQVAAALDSFAPSIVNAFIKSPQDGRDTLRAAIEQAVR